MKDPGPDLVIVPEPSEGPPLCPAAASSDHDTGLLDGVAPVLAATAS